MKNRRTRRVLYAVLALQVVLGAAAYGGFERYRVILERKPFGKPPPEPEPVVTDEDPPWTKEYRLCSVYQEEDQPVEVALVDPLAMMSVVDNAELAAVAAEARARLERVALALRG